MRDGNVPMCILRRSNGGKVTFEAVEFKDATHILVGTDECPTSDSECNFILHGVVIKGVRLSGSAMSYRYALVDQYLLTRRKEVISIMTRHFNGLYESIDISEPLNLAPLFRDRYPDRSNNPKMDRLMLSNLSNTKITAQHHLHFTVDEMIKVLGSKKVLASPATRLPRDATLSMAAGVILWFDTLDEEMQVLMDGTGLFKTHSIKEFKVVAKNISVEAKSLQNIVEKDLRSIFEIDTLINRIDGEVDWAEEKDHRINPNVTKFDYETVYQAAAAIFISASACGRKPIKMKWEKYWNSRWQWSAAGSVHSQYAEDEKYVVRTDRNLKNKFIAISNMPGYSKDHFLGRPPQLHAWSSVKYEWGKLRAIYGTDITSYIVSNFAFYNCENVLPRRFPVGKDANDANVVNRVAGVLRGRLPYCLDFEDFNSQHSVSSMQAVINAYGDVFRDSFEPEQLEAVEWTARSLKHTIINDNMGLKTQYKSEGTLLSGWRLTTFVNSVLNAVYTDLICQDTKARGSSLHNGDDVLIGTLNLVTAQRSLKKGEEYNVRVQPSKCAFGGIAEFLRIDHARGSKGQYLTRAVATLMHSRIESKLSLDARDLVESMESRFSDCRNRGMSIATIAKLRQVYYERQALICSMKVEDFYKIKNIHRVAGGISEQIDSDVDVAVLKGDNIGKEILLPNLQGVFDYSRAVAKELGMEDRLEYITQRMYKATYEAVAPKSKQIRVVSNKEERWCYNVKAIYKAFKGQIQTAGYGKAALVGMALDVIQSSEKDTTLKLALQRSKDPIKLLRYLV
jgi:hypothetical protein